MRLNPIFSDGMILQAGKPIRLFGTGGGVLRAELNGCCREKEFQAPSWMVELPPMDYGGPYELTVTADGRRKVIHDVWIGDVYLISGQSNMTFQLQFTDYPREDYRSDDKLRLFSLEAVEGNRPFLPEDGWVPCRAEEMGKWPGVGAIVGAMLSERCDHAVGLIACAQGAAAIQAFLPSEVFENPDFVIDEEKRFDMIYPWNQGHSVLYDFVVKQVLPYSLKAVLWYQGESNDSEPESRVYGAMLEKLIEVWRRDFLDARLRFIIVQIADNVDREGDPWSRIQQAQAEVTEKTPDAELVICRDICENDQIHPVRKTELARRIVRLLA